MRLLPFFFFFFALLLVAVFAGRPLPSQDPYASAYEIMAVVLRDHMKSNRVENSYHGGNQYVVQFPLRPYKYALSEASRQNRAG
jgi:hypothetical protein